MKRELRHIYFTILKVPGKQLNLNDIIKFYDEYYDFRYKVVNNECAPSAIKTQLAPVKVPQYMEWLKQYLLDDKGN